MAHQIKISIRIRLLFSNGLTRGIPNIRFWITDPAKQRRTDDKTLPNGLLLAKLDPTINNKKIDVHNTDGSGMNITWGSQWDMADVLIEEQIRRELTQGYCWETAHYYIIY